MKKMLLLALIVCLASIGFAVESNAAGNTVNYRNAKAVALGDSRIAGGFGYNGFVDNPALLSRVGALRFSLVNMPITINKNTVDIGDFVNDNQDNFENYDDLTTDEKSAFLKEVEKEEGKWSRINVAPMIDVATTIMGHSFGLAIYNSTDVGFKVDRGIYEPRVWGEGYSNSAIVLGYARPLTMLTPGLTVGVNLKYIQRRRASMFQISATELGDADETMDPIVDEIENNEHNTFAMDFGMLWDIPIIDAEVGAAVQSVGDGRGSSVDFGIAKRFYEDRVTVLADYIDFFDNNKENVLNKLHFGAQYDLSFIKVRGGLNSGYPTAGLGFDTRVVDLDFAYFFDELGNAPGMNEDTRYMFQFKLGW